MLGQAPKSNYFFCLILEEHPVAALLAGRRATIYAQSGTSSLLGSVLQLGYSLPPSAVVIMLLD